jgi:DNA-directed RNA polymerase subunit RPC12/RpoP
MKCKKYNHLNIFIHSPRTNIDMLFASFDFYFENWPDDSYRQGQVCFPLEVIHSLNCPSPILQTLYLGDYLFPSRTSFGTEDEKMEETVDFDNNVEVGVGVDVINVSNNVNVDVNVDVDVNIVNEDVNNVNNDCDGVNIDNLSMVGGIDENIDENIDEGIHEDIHEGMHEGIQVNRDNRQSSTLITSFGFAMDTLDGLEEFGDGDVLGGMDNHLYESSLRTATTTASSVYREESEVVDVVESREALLTIHNGYMNEIFLPIPFLNPIVMKELFFTRNLTCMGDTGECLICRSEEVKLYDVHGESNRMESMMDEKHLVCMKCLLSLVSVFDAETEKRTIPCPYCRQNIFFS